ncbi:MAG: DinB family protein [Caldilineaceae bacterium]|nr:DinB family protein [Caldilineaceae bacterium]
MTQDHPAPARALGAEYAERLRRSYLNFRWPLFLLEPDEQTRPCLENGWTPIAAAAHVAYWDNYQLRRMQAAVEPHRKEPGPVSVETNDEMAAGENRSWDTVLGEADEARQALITFALSLTDDQIEAEYVDRGERTRIVKRLLEHMPKHVAEHAVDVHRYCFSTDRWSREQLFSFYRRHCNSLLDAITGLTEESCVTVPVSGNWTVRDLLAHILAWDEYVLELVKRWPDISSPDAQTSGQEIRREDELSHWASGDVDTVNARLHEARAELSMIEVLDGLATCHRRIVSRCRRLSDEEMRTEVEYDAGEKGNVVNLLVSTSAHTADHAAEIYAARADGRLVPLRLPS